MKRRTFLASMALSGGVMLPVGRNTWALAAGGSQHDQDKAAGRRLIVIMLRGAIDGLSVVAPYGDPDYARQRPSIALAPPGGGNGLIDLDGHFGMHPALVALQPLWEQGKLAFVHASGSPDPTRSHFDAQDYLESGTPGRKATPDGWLNRIASALSGAPSPIRAIAIGPVMPRILVGSAAAATLAYGPNRDKAGFLDRPEIAAAFDQLYRHDERLGRVYIEAMQARKEIIAAPQDKAMEAADGGAPLPHGFPEEAARLAALMRSHPDIRLAFMDLGGWDTHAGQGAAKGLLANRLAPLGQGLAELARRLGFLFDDTVIVVLSEFGRTVRENGTGGTDHGHGNVMWLAGGRVAGGKVHGDWPGLRESQLHEGRDLAVTTDFRCVLAQIAQYHLLLKETALADAFPSFRLPPRTKLFRA